MRHLRGPHNTPSLRQWRLPRPPPVAYNTAVKSAAPIHLTSVALHHSHARGAPMKAAVGRSRHLAAVIGLAMLAAGCATATQTTESLLAQAGFRQLPADTPQKLDHLQTLPERRIV